MTTGTVYIYIRVQRPLKNTDNRDLFRSQFPQQVVFVETRRTPYEATRSEMVQEYGISFCLIKWFA